MKKLVAVSALAFLTSGAIGADEVLNSRGLMCDAIDFAELNTLTQKELENFFCSYSQGHKIVEKTMNASADKHKGTRTEIAILQDGLRAMEKCSRPMMRIADLLKRRFEGTKNIRCEEYRGWDASSSSSQSTTKSSTSPDW